MSNDPANFYARLESAQDAEDRRNRRIESPPKKHSCSNCIDLQFTIKAADRVIFKLEEEIYRLRSIFPKICEAIGNGSCCANDSSILFLEGIPEEVRLHVRQNVHVQPRPITPTQEITADE